MTLDPELKARYVYAKQENQEVCAAEHQLEQFIQKLEKEKQIVLQDPSYAQYAYVTHDDLKALNQFNRQGAQGEE